MLPQIAGIRKCLIALLTPVRAHSHVHQDVHVEFGLRVKRSHAHVTLPPAWAHVCMGVLVVTLELS